MKNKILLLTAITVGLAALLSSPVLALHDEGVAHCNVCHTMHNSQNGVPMNGTMLDGEGNPTNGLPVGSGYADLLLFSNKSDVCLRCHAGLNSYHVWADDVMVPGFEHGAGNFVWLEEDNINDGHGGGGGTCDVATCGDADDEPCEDYYDCDAEGGSWTWGADAIPGTAAGHSIASGIKGTVSDTILAAAPGGTFDSTDLNCASCHDPHGNDGFRLLYKDGQANSNGVSFPTIDAVGINKFFLFGGDPTETNTNHNVYKSGYSEWCAACHGDFHAASASLVHPSGELLDAEQVNSYNQYLGTSNCIDNPPTGPNDPCGNGVKATAYLAMVPIEDATFTDDVDSTVGATDGTSRVACVSCHRAHATSAPDAGRWDFNVTGLAEDGYESVSYPMPNPFDEFQRSLCNKCHSQDEYDAAVDFTP